MKHLLVKAQKQILKLVVEHYPQVYLVGGTALSFYFNHRVSEDLDFFTQQYTAKLHKEITRYIKQKTGFPLVLVDEEKRNKFVKMAVYEFEINKDEFLKVDFVSDCTQLLKPRMKNGLASLEDIYYRKILAVIGFSGVESKVGKMLPGGRQKTKDLYDLFYLSAHEVPLSSWFGKHFDQSSYERLTHWYLSIPKQKVVSELLELVPKCDTRVLFKHLDDEIVHKLNREHFT